MSAPSGIARGTVTRASRPRRRHPPPHRPRPRVTDARSEGQESARSRPEPQRAKRTRPAQPGGYSAATEARTPSTRPCPKRARRYPPPLDGLSVCPARVFARRSAAQLLVTVPVQPTDPPGEPNFILDRLLEGDPQKIWPIAAECGVGVGHEHAEPPQSPIIPFRHHRRGVEHHR